MSRSVGVIHDYLIEVLKHAVSRFDTIETWVTRGVAVIAIGLGAVGLDAFTDARQSLVWTAAAALWLVFVFFIEAPARIWKTATDRIAEYEEASRPKLRIVFAPTNDEDSRPYLQTQVFNIIEGRLRVQMRDRRFRVGIQNMSSSTIPGVTLRLARCEPGGNFVFPEHELAVQDTDPPAGACDVPPSRDDVPTRWFDVVNELGPASFVPNTFRFCYRNPDFCQLPVASGTYKIELRAEGGGTSTTKRFIIRKTSPEGLAIPLTMEPR